MRRAWLAAAVLLALVVLGATAWVVRARARHRPLLPPLARAVPDSARAPDGLRVRVEVLNTTKVKGLARRATLLLRDRGFDVVEIGTVAIPQDTTLVLDRSGHPDWAAAAAAAMGPAARAESRRDSSHYLDVTVLVGRLWRPPALPLYP